MQLLEFQSKRILAAYGVSVPRSVLIFNKFEPVFISPPMLFKQQGKTGERGIPAISKVVHPGEDYLGKLNVLFSKEAQENPVGAILLEEMVEVKRQFYLAAQFDQYSYKPVIVAYSLNGLGMNEMASRQPEKIAKKYFDPVIGIQFFEVQDIARTIGLTEWEDLMALLRRMQDIMINIDATLIEINPLALTDNGLIALDANIILDAKAEFRHKQLFENLKMEQNQIINSHRYGIENLRWTEETVCSSSSGNMGLIFNDRETGMLMIDLIHNLGGKLAHSCQCDIQEDVKCVSNAIDFILSDPDIKVVLINLFVELPGIEDTVTEIINYHRKKKTKVPHVLRIWGLEEELSQDTSDETGITIHNSLTEAVYQAVELARI